MFGDFPSIYFGDPLPPRVLNVRVPDVPVLMSISHLVDLANLLILVNLAIMVILTILVILMN